MSAVFVDTSALLALFEPEGRQPRSRCAHLHDAPLPFGAARDDIVTMRQRQMTEAFAFDPHFEQEGFGPVG